jgi:hypothetical protein
MKIQVVIYWVVTRTGGGALSPGVKGPEHEADHSPPSNTEVKNAWSYTSTPSYIFMWWCIIKQMTRLHDVVLS